MSIEVKDELLKGACDAQRSNGVMPTVADNERFLKDILERFDNKPKQKLTRSPEPRKKDTQRLRDEAKLRGYEIEGDFSVERNETTPLALGGPLVQRKVEGELKRRLRKRLRLINSKPEWRNRIVSINITHALQGRSGSTPEERAYKQEAAAEEVRKVIEASNRLWGDWWKPEPRTLFSYKGQVKR